MHSLSEGFANRLALIALGHVTREYPNKLDHVLAGAADARTPSALHPVFYGSFDWHSCVHSYWMLTRLLRRFPGMPAAPEVEALFDRQLVPEKVETECAYLRRPEARGFERPYGWGWLLKLAAELALLPEKRWSLALSPLAGMFAERFRDFLPIAGLPVRTGSHTNGAFALRLAADYAETAGQAEFLSTLRHVARSWYGADAECPCWGEPGGDDFLSAALVEAECMRRLLPAEEFLPWFGRFLPLLAEGEPATLFTPVQPTDRSDGKIAHLDGLNLSRAWCFGALAASLPAGDKRRPTMLDAAARHLDASLPHLDGHYMGEHWLATFAVLAIDET